MGSVSHPKPAIKMVDITLQGRVLYAVGVQIDAQVWGAMAFETVCRQRPRRSPRAYIGIARANSKIADNQRAIRLLALALERWSIVV